MNELPEDIELIIYSFVGNNFILNKRIYDKIKRIEREFL